MMAVTAYYIFWMLQCERKVLVTPDGSPALSGLWCWITTITRVVGNSGDT
jgi:hypothetical protein